MRPLDQATGQLIPIGGGGPVPPMVIGLNATSPGVYNAFDPSTLACSERVFADALKIDFACPSQALDVDGVTRIGERWPDIPFR